MAQISTDSSGGSEDVPFGITWLLIQNIVMETCSYLHSILSFLGILYFLFMILVSMRGVRANEVEDQQQHQRPDRDVPPEVSSSKKPKCGATAIRLNLDLARLHGKWYPQEASDSAFSLWMTSLYGKGDNVSAMMTRPECIVLDLQPGPEDLTLNIDLTHKNKSTTVQAALLADAVHPGTSKWVISWPNGEDTLTSIVATGSLNSMSEYDWMLTVDCDLNGSVAPDWAIFSREQGLSVEGMEAIKAILNGIEGLRQTTGHKTDAKSCGFHE